VQAKLAEHVPDRKPGSDDDRGTGKPEEEHEGRRDHFDHKETRDDKQHQRSERGGFRGIDGHGHSGSKTLRYVETAKRKNKMPGKQDKRKNNEVHQLDAHRKE
jgi:hypothetical protein